MSFVNIQAEESGERIDALLARSLAGLSRSAAQRLLAEGRVRHGEKALKKNERLNVGDLISVELPDETAEIPLQPQEIPLDIVFEDRDLLVINKVRGMVVHPAPGHPDGTLVNALLFHCGDELSGIGGEKRPGIVHRIDKDSSGLLLVAKNYFAHRALSDQLSDHSLCRVYEAVVHGHFREASGTVDRPIGRHPVDRKRMAVTEKNSRHAVTHWELIASYKGYSRIRCRLETGRTHQIRVHMASLGHPLLGDGLYGAPDPEKGLSGQCLHAGEIRFVHPRSGESLSFQAPLPPYFLEVLDRLGPEISA